MRIIGGAGQSPECLEYILEHELVHLRETPQRQFPTVDEPIYAQMTFEPGFAEERAAGLRDVGILMLFEGDPIGYAR